MPDAATWGVSDDVEGAPVAGTRGAISRPLPGMPGRLVGAVTVPADATRVLLGVRDADGVVTGLRLLPLAGVQAVLVRQDAAGADVASAGSVSLGTALVAFNLRLAGGRLTAELAGAEVHAPLAIDLPAPPVAVVLAAEGRSPALFSELRAEP